MDRAWQRGSSQEALSGGVQGCRAAVDTGKVTMGNGSAKVTTDPAAAATSRASRGRPSSAVVATLVVWGLGYACYRAYYAVGGEWGMIGRPASDGQFRMVNAVGSAIVLLGAVLPVVLRGPALRPVVPVLGWVGAVGCCMHALVDIVLRLLSVAGVHPTQLPEEFWLSFDRKSADLQDLLFNEPWFLVEGLLWAALGIACVRASRRRGWLASVVGACLLLTGVGILSGLGIIGSFRLG